MGIPLEKVRKRIVSAAIEEALEEEVVFQSLGVFRRVPGHCIDAA